MLNNYIPTPEEEPYKKGMLAFINAYENCFERSLEVGHITASSWLLNNDCSRVLLMHHTKLDMWVQLGGHCDGDSDVLAVAIKEAQEEWGIQNIEPIFSDVFDIDIHLIPETKKEKAHYHYDVRFLLRVVSDEQMVQNEESKALKWFDKNSTLPTQERSILRMYQKWIDQII